MYSNVIPDLTIIRYECNLEIVSVWVTSPALAPYGRRRLRLRRNAFYARQIDVYE